MSILSMIREKKEEFSQRQNERSAAKLQKLKKQRVKAEGKNNISRLKDQERSRIKNVNPAFGLGKEKKAEKKEESVFRIRIK